jgi:DNA-binding NtrC family response regulator
VVEHDPSKRETVTTLLEESDFDVISCESAEAATQVLRDNGAITFLLTDVQLNGAMDGIELAHYAQNRMPQLRIMVMSERPLVRRLPDGSSFYARPWRPLDVLRKATF